ncbi:MAG: response regulator [Rhodoferax sp.]|nr:response regulator [Rhodoferax sp.]
MTALRKVLVVDDDPVVGKSFHRVLSQDKGYVVITAHNAAEALERMRDQAYDLIVTDIKMPGMDGVELAEQVRAKQPWTPVVIVTGFGSAAAQERARVAGVSAFVHKPLSPEMIEATAEQAMQAPAAPLVPAAVQAPAEVAPVVAKVSDERQVRSGAMAMAAPFISLAFVVLLPLMGLGLLAWSAARGVAKRLTLRNLGIACTPLLGLAFVVALPVAGTLTLLWMSMRYPLDDIALN